MVGEPVEQSGGHLGVAEYGRPLAEGASTAGIAARIAREKGVDAPIIEAVDRILRGKASIAEAVAALLSRPLKSEQEQRQGNGDHR